MRIHPLANANPPSGRQSDLGDLGASASAAAAPSAPSAPSAPARSEETAMSDHLGRLALHSQPAAQSTSHPHSQSAAQSTGQQIAPREQRQAVSWRAVVSGQDYNETVYKALNQTIYYPPFKIKSLLSVRSISDSLSAELAALETLIELRVV